MAKTSQVSPDDEGGGHTSFLETARRRFKEAIDATTDNRSSQLDDVKFAAGSPDNGWQWPDKLRNDRQNDPNGARPVLTINKLPQHINQITNEQRQNRPGIHVLPVDNKGDVEVAEVFDGVIRHIMANSDADLALDTAGENQVRQGEGFFRVLTDYCNELSFDQDILIRRIRNSFAVYMDPNIQDPSGADAQWCFITDEMSKDEFKERFPEAEDTILSWDQQGLGDDMKAWLDGEKVRIAEYFSFKNKKVQIHLWPDGSVTQEGEVPPVPMAKPVKSRETTIKQVKWAKLAACDVLEENDWAGKYIPVVRVVGNEFDVEGKLIVSGIVRNAKDAQRMYNYWASQETEMLALAPKAPFIGAVGQFESMSNDWAQANIKNLSRLEYDPISVDSVVLPPPQRQMPPMVPAGIVNAKLGAADDIKSATGQYDAALGKEAQAKSGVALKREQIKSDMGTFHYLDNQARSVRHLGRILVDLVPKIYDTKRVARILGEDGKSPEHVTLDPNQQTAVMEITGEDGAIEKIYNLNVGSYDVTVATGPSYTTKRQEAAEFMAQVLQGNRELMAVIGDLYFGMLDVPGADEIAKRLKKTLPPNLGDDDEDEPAPMVMTPQGPLPLDGASQLIAQQMAQIEEMGAQMEKVQGEAKAVEQGKHEIEKAVADLNAQQDSLKAAEQNLVLKQQLVMKTLEAEDAKSEAERTRIVADMKMLVNEAVSRLEAAKQDQAEMKEGADAEATAKENAKVEQRNEVVTQMQQELLQALTQAIQVLAAPRRTRLVNGPDGMPSESVSEIER